MSKHQTIKAIRQEIERLNKEIDLKIIHGFPYAREAKRHRMLLSQLSRISPCHSWLHRTIRAVAMNFF